MDICLTTHTRTSDSGDEAGFGESPFGGHSNSPPGPSLQSPGGTISKEEAWMAVVLTEYFQEQRRLYEQVCYLRAVLCFVYVCECVSLCVCVCVCMCLYLSVYTLACVLCLD